MEETRAMKDLQKIAAQLLALNQQIDRRDMFPTLHPAAADLVLENPYAFCLATCLDRGTKAEVIWTIPYWLLQLLGHLDPFVIYGMQEASLASLIAQLPRKPRYTSDAPRTIREITTVIVEHFDGDASRIWKDRSAADVKATFQSVYGVGPGIANMAVLLIERTYGIRFSDLDHRYIDIKPDVHTMRVLYRLGVALAQNETQAINAAKRLNPDYPGEIDAPLWLIGRNWCVPGTPRCEECPLVNVCPQTYGG